jgi:hypothetical protein
MAPSQPGPSDPRSDRGAALKCKHDYAMNACPLPHDDPDPEEPTTSADSAPDDEAPSS